MDFNGDGDWNDDGEHIIPNFQLGSVENQGIIFQVPDITGGFFTYARFRYSSQANLPPTGSAPNGEVEDYKVYIN